MPGKTPPFRLYAQILIFSALVVLGVLILLPLQRSVYGGMISIRDDLINRMESRIGRKIRYSSISPSILGSFDVRNIRITGEDGDIVLAVSRFRIAYSLLDLLRGRTRSIRSVQIDAPIVDLDTARDQDLLDLFKKSDSGREGSLPPIAEMLPQKLLVRVRNGTCIVNTATDQFELDTLNFSAEIEGKRVILDGRWTSGITAGRLIGEPVSVQVGMRITGSCGIDLEDGEGVFSIPSVTGDAHSSSSLAFGFLVAGRSLNLWKMSDALPLDISLQFGIDDGTVDARLESREFLFREYISFSGGLENARQLLDIAASGTASFTRNQDGAIGYSVDLAGEAFDGSSSSFEIRASGNEKIVRIGTFHLFMPKLADSRSFFYGNAGFSGTVDLDPPAPSGMISLDNFSISGIENIDAKISVNSHEGEIILFCDTMNIGQVELTAVSALFQPAENDLGFAVSALRFMDVESYDRVRLGRFSLEGTMDSASRRIEASLLLDSFSAGDIVSMTLPFLDNPPLQPAFVSVLRNTSITTELFFSTDFVHLLFNAPRFVFSSGTGRPFMGLVSLSGSDRRFELNDGRFIWGEEALLLSCEAEYSGVKDIKFSVNANYRDLGYFVEGTVLEGNSINIRGSYGLNVTLAAFGRGYTGILRASGFPLPFIGHPALLSFSAMLRYETPAAWSMELQEFEAINIASPIGIARLRISGGANQNGLNLPVLRYSDRLGELSGSANLSWADNYSAFNGGISFEQGREMYRADGSYRNRHLELFISGSSMRLDRVLGNLNNTLADANIWLSWDSIDSFRAECQLSSLSGRVLNQEFRLSANAQMDPNELIVSGVHFDIAGVQGTMPRFILGGKQGFLQAGTELKGAAGGRRVEGGLSFAADFRPMQSWFQIGDALRSVSGTVGFSDFLYGSSQQPQSFEFVFSRRGGGFSASGGPRNMLRLQMDEGGSFYAGLSSPFPVRGTVVGSIGQNTINARCADLYVDMAGLFEMLPESPDIYLTGGYVNGSVNIRGPITDPEFFGNVRGTSLRFKIPQFMPQELRPIPFNVAIDGNEARFGPVSVAVGNGAGTAEGWFRFDRWIPNIFSLDIQVGRDTPIPYHFGQSGFNARGDVSGKLNIAMENVHMDITGELYANNSELGINSDEVILAQGGELFPNVQIPFSVNLAVVTGPAVEFLYPSSRFPILRATADMGTRLYVTGDSAAQQFSLTSDVRIRGGEIYYFERSFYIRSGTLVFRENERVFEPRLTARAEARDRNDDGPVTISMIVDNAPLLSFTARFESSPPLSQMEIFALMGQSLTGSQMDEDPGSFQKAILNSTTDLLAQFILVRQLEQQVRNFMRLDMFSVRTQVLQNMVFMATGITDTPVDRTPSVGNYFDNTTILGGKYIGQAMFVQGMLTMNYDANREFMGGLNLRPDFGIELQNPLFTVRWDFVPEHPENWYINDNSITLTRTLSF